MHEPTCARGPPKGAAAHGRHLRARVGRVLPRPHLPGYTEPMITLLARIPAHVRHLLLVSIVACVLPSTAAAVTASAGSPDASFGVNGVATHDYQTGNLDYAATVATQADGKVLVAGHDQASGRVTLLRYTSTGALDTSFGGGDGIAASPALVTGGVGRAIIVDPTGLIYVAADRPTGSPGTETWLIRFTDAGVPDATFGVGGVVAYGATIIDPTDQITVSELLRTPSGTMLIVGSAHFTGPGLWQGYIRKLDASGAVVGANYESVSNNMRFKAATLSADGANVLAAGFVTIGLDDESILGRYPVSSLGSTGTALASLSSFAGGDDRIEAIVPFGSGFLISGMQTADVLGTYTSFVAKTLLADGTLTLDPAFGTGGITRFSVNPGSVSAASALGITSDGAILAAVRSSNVDFNWQPFVVRLTSTGLLDPSFGAGTGAAALNGVGENALGESPYDLAVDSLDRALVAGYSVTGTEPVHRAWRSWGAQGDLAISAARLGTSVLRAGSSTIVRISLANSGNDRAAATSAALTVPGAASFTPSSGSCSAAGACSFGTLAAGATVTVDAVVPLAHAGTVSVSATAATASADPSSINDAASLTLTVARRATVLRMRHVAPSGLTFRCGARLSTPCAASATALFRLAGTRRPIVATPALRVVRFTVQQWVGGRWRTTRLTGLPTPSANRTTGAWTARLPAGLPRGAVRVRGAVRGGLDDSAATTPWMYLRVR